MKDNEWHNTGGGTHQAAKFDFKRRPRVRIGVLSSGKT